MPARPTAGLLALALLLAVSACAPAAPGQPGGGPAQADQPRAPKVLTWAVQREPTDLLALSGVGGTIGPTSEFGKIAHSTLVAPDNTLTYKPNLAVELPSVAKGTWVVNADGTMDTTWKLHSNVKWHDGVPFTSSDLLFWFSAVKEPIVPSIRVIGLPFMESVTAPDAYTFAIHWSRPYFRADRTPDVSPLPRHLLEGLYQAKDAEAFINNSYFTTEFIGLGPYKLSHWEQGSQVEFVRFEEYYRGRPPLDRVILRFIPDFNTMLSNVLSGAVDVALPTAGNLEATLDVKRRWEGTGNRVNSDPSDRMRYVEIQQRPDFARPRNGMTDRTVRQALYHAIDRVTFVGTITQGESPVADSWFSPTDSLRREVQASIPQFPYDPARAQQLLAQAGWVRGADGVPINQPSGERLEIELWNRPGSGTENELEIIADNWKGVGVAGKVFPVPTARINDREYLSTYPGVLITNPPVEDLYNTERLHTKNIASPANRWTSRNGSGYSNPAGDALQDRLVTTIDPTQQVAIHRQLVQDMMTDVPIMPLYWEVRSALVLRGVKGNVTGLQTGWNIFDWDKE